MILMFFGLLNWALLSRSAYYIYTYRMLKKDWSLGNAWIYDIMIVLNSAFYACAIIFWLFNWVFLISKIEILKSNNDRIVSLYKIKIAWILILILAVLIWASYYVVDCTSRSDKSNAAISVKMILAAFYYAMAAAFIAYGILFMKKLKIFKYTQVQLIKKRIIMTIVLLTTPLLMKGTYNIVDYWFSLSKFWVTSIDENSIAYPLFCISYFLFSDCISVISQVVSVLIINNNKHSNSWDSSRLSKKKIKKDVVDAYNTSIDDVYESDSVGFNDESLMETKNDAKSPFHSLATSTTRQTTN